MSETRMPEYRHTVKKWENNHFRDVASTSTSYYSIASHMDEGDDIDEMDVNTLGELYKLWQEQKSSDKASGDTGWKYSFYHHEVELSTENGRPVFIDNVTPGKVYRRGNKIFFRPIAE